MPKRLLTLVGQLTERIERLRGEELEELLFTIEYAHTVVLEEIESRSETHPEMHLKLVADNPEND